jgi:hypothetical protein
VRLDRVLSRAAVKPNPGFTTAIGEARVDAGLSRESVCVKLGAELISPLKERMMAGF